MKPGKSSKKASAVRPIGGAMDCEHPGFRRLYDATHPGSGSAWREVCRSSPTTCEKANADMKIIEAQIVA
jgi:hypothetical protein